MMHSLVVRFTFTCRACGEQATACHKLPADSEVPRPCPPPGWRMVAGSHFCGEHALTLRVVTRGEIAVEIAL